MASSSTTYGPILGPYDGGQPSRPNSMVNLGIGAFGVTNSPPSKYLIGSPVIGDSSKDGTTREQSKLYLSTQVKQPPTHYHRAPERARESVSCLKFFPYLVCLLPVPTPMKVLYSTARLRETRIVVLSQSGRMRRGRGNL